MTRSQLTQKPPQGQDVGCARITPRKCSVTHWGYRKKPHQTSLCSDLVLPGQYYDQETGLHYNYFRDYDPATGRYIQSDPLGLLGSTSTYGYSYQNPIYFTDPFGLFGYAQHVEFTYKAIAGYGNYSSLPNKVAEVDNLPGSQDPYNSYWHAMSDGLSGQTPEEAKELFYGYVELQIKLCTLDGLARAIHAVQDSVASGHRDFQPWDGGFGPLHIPTTDHLKGDAINLGQEERNNAVVKTKDVIQRYEKICQCEKK